MTNPLLIELPDSLETRRLQLRPPRRGDGEIMHRALVESLPDLRRFLSFLPWVAEEQTIDSAEIYCRNAQSNFLARKDMPFFLFDRSTGRMVGASGLHRPDWAVPKAEVGYWVRTSESSKGYATEAVEALVRLAFDTLRARRVELVTDEENAASRRVADRCRFQLEGVLRNERRAPDGSLRNTCIYARHESDRPV